MKKELIEKIKISSFTQNAEGVLWLFVGSYAIKNLVGVPFEIAFGGALIIVALLVVKDAFKWSANLENEDKTSLVDQLERDLVAKNAQIDAIKTQSDSKVSAYLSQIAEANAQIEKLQEQNSAYASQMQKAALQIAASQSQIEFLQEAEKHNAPLREKGKIYERLVVRASNEGWDEAKLTRFLFDDFSESRKNACLQKTIQNSNSKIRGGTENA